MKPGTANHPPETPRWKLITQIAPELITAASDNDPTNIGAAALVGSQTGYQLSWVALLIAPLLAVVLGIAARVGSVGRGDLQSLVLKHYGQSVARMLLVSVVVVNLITIAADLEAGAAGIGMLTGIGSGWFVLPLSLALVGLMLIGKYNRLVAVMRYLLVGFVAFGAAAVLARPDWHEALRASFVPNLAFSTDSFSGILAMLGTTLTSYVYMWEIIARKVEDHDDPGPVGKKVQRANLGAVVGSVFTALILWSMLITFAATLGAHREVADTAQDAARALLPLAGPLAADVFAAGLVTSAVVALPVLLATTAYTVGVELDWQRGLSRRTGHARGFYGVLTVAIGLAAIVDMAGVSVITMLAVANVMGGLAAPVGLILLVRLARNPQVMGNQLISRRLAIAGWAVALAVGGSGILYLFAELARITRVILGGLAAWPLDRPQSSPVKVMQRAEDSAGRQRSASHCVPEQPKSFQLECRGVDRFVDIAVGRLNVVSPGRPEGGDRASTRARIPPCAVLAALLLFYGEVQGR
jgi:Mn2+/Fe2+ NRAMP family transporter